MKFFEFTQTVDPNIEVLDQELRSAITQIDGIQYTPSTKKLVVISFNDNQTSGPIETVVNNHNPLTKSQSTLDREQIRDNLQNLRDYINLSSPTQAQTIAIVKLLCRAVLYIVKYLIRLEG